MGDRPSGTVTFLFTDVEGSTRLWAEHSAEMRTALERHDEILRSSIEGHGGYVFSTAGDAFAAAFSRAGDAIAAAVEAQQTLGTEPWPEATVVRVRMGLHTGEAQERDGDYFGTVLNRAARVMAAGHGGQILLAGSTAAVVEGVDLVDLGEHRLKDLAATEHLFQVRADGLDDEFAALRTVDEVPGNLPVQSTSFVGRAGEVSELSELVRVHRLVTLTGVGGVGKTRLATQVAAELTGEFGDGVWLVELAAVGDPAAVPDAVATVLGITSQGGSTVTASVAAAVTGRRLLIVLDNCEHVVDAAADLVEAILAHSDDVKVLATSREGLQLSAEHLWPVPSLGIADGAGSAVELFCERSRAVNPTLELETPANVEAVTEICRRLDGIALAIELAAARMVSMGPAEVLERLTDRFRLLAGSRRGLERHQTLRHAVGWSYDLLDDDERQLLNRCSVFADSFDLAAATHVCGDGLDDFAVLDLLDSLVRKSLVNARQVLGRSRYGLLETIRQYGEEQLAAGGGIDQVRDRHAQYFAEQAIEHWGLWTGPEQRVAIDWIEVEFANLRSGFRRATDRGELVTAAAIASHAALMGWILFRLEPVGWAEEILEEATTADIEQLPKLFTAAGCCYLMGRPEDAVTYAEHAVSLSTDPRYEPFVDGWDYLAVAGAHLYCGRHDHALEIVSTKMTAQSGFAHLLGLACELTVAAVVDPEPGIAIADEALTGARAFGNPYLIAQALYGYGRVFSNADPDRALQALREGLTYTKAQRLRGLEAQIAREAAVLEAAHGDIRAALTMFDAAIDSQHRAGSSSHQAIALASLAVLFDRIDRPRTAATIYGTSTHNAANSMVINLATALEHVRTVLGDVTFDDCVATGAAMEPGEAVQYVRHQIGLAQQQDPSHG